MKSSAHQMNDYNDDLTFLPERSLSDYIGSISIAGNERTTLLFSIAASTDLPEKLGCLEP